MKINFANQLIAIFSLESDPITPITPIGIPIQDITKVKILLNWDPCKSTIIVQTSETSETWIRKVLGMSETEDKKGFFSPTSKGKRQCGNIYSS